MSRLRLVLGGRGELRLTKGPEDELGSLIEPIKAFLPKNTIMNSLAIAATPEGANRQILANIKTLKFKDSPLRKQE